MSSATDGHVPCSKPAVRVQPRERPMREAALLVGAAALYFGLRVVVEGSEESALRNADRLLGVERALGLDVERSAQNAVIDNDLVRHVANFSYVWLHWPLLIVRTDEHYYAYRNALVISGAVGLAIFTFFPVAPPRFLPGFLGTVGHGARTHYLNFPVSWSNRFAAFPSFHVGWTALACVALASSIDRRALKVAAMVPAVLVAMAVVVTGNHYVGDAIVGLILSIGAYLLFRRAGL